MKNATLFLISFLIAHCTYAQNSNYGLAIRGNGELMPSHWGAIAQTVETYGVPGMLAGGSSASISSFLIESVLINPYVSNSSGEEKIQRAALLIKSFQGFITNTFQDPKWKALFQFLQSNPDLTQLQKAIAALLDPTNNQDDAKKTRAVLSAIDDIRKTKVFYGPAIQKLQSSLTKNQNKEEVLLLAQSVQEALAVIGKFDAKNDNSLLLRDGVVNFEAMAELFGKMADFYSLSKTDQKSKQLFLNFLNLCSKNTTGLLWSQIVSANSECQTAIGLAAESYFQSRTGPSVRAQNKVGQYIPTLISTAVAIGETAKSLIETKRAYDKGLNVGSESDYINPNEIKFGYWGQLRDLNKVKASFDNSDLNISQPHKSQQFFDLGEVAWKVALSLSPAEPGLSSVLPIPNTSYLSLGGWSDLHPTLVLRALSANDVIYITRRGGDSLFGQGLAKRVMGLDRNWEQLDPYNKQSTANNNNGDDSDMTSLWSRMYNLANPDSSFSVSLKQSSAVVCTNWNSFDIKKDFTKMIEDAYQAPIYESHKINRTNLKEPLLISETENIRNDSGFNEYAGCIP